MKKVLVLLMTMVMLLCCCSLPAFADEPRVLRIGISIAGNQDYGAEYGNETTLDNWATRYIIENWAKPNNVDLRFELIDATNDSALQVYMLMLASEDAPDLWYLTVGEGSSWVRKQAADDLLYDLSGLIEQYGENIISFLGMDFIKRYGGVGDAIVAIPGKEPIPAISHTWMRKDWLDILGLEVPDTFEEWYACMVAFKERANELEAAGAVKSAESVVPYGMYHTRYFTDWERIVTRFYPAETFDETSLAYYTSGYGIEYVKEGFKEGIQFMNQMYRDGLISPNFALDSDLSVYNRDIAQGNTGCYVNNLFHGWGPSNPDSLHLVSAANVGAQWVYVEPFTNLEDGQHRNPLDPVVFTYAFVPYFSKAADLAVQFLNFVWDPEVNTYIQYGEEGVSYEMSDVGPVTYPVEQQNANGWYHHMAGRELLMIGRSVNDDWARILRSGAKTSEEAEYAMEILDAIEDNGYQRFPSELNSVEEKSQYMNGLRDTWTKFLTDLIMAENDEAFEAVWTSGIEELESLGSQKIVDAITDFYYETLLPEFQAKGMVKP